MYQVERAGRQPGAPGVGRNDLNVAEPAPRRELARHRDMSRISVHADDASPWRDPRGEQLDDAAGTTAEVDRAVPRPGANPVEQRGAGRPQLLGLALQPGAFSRIAAQRIRGGGRRIGPHTLRLV